MAFVGFFFKKKLSCCLLLACCQAGKHGKMLVVWRFCLQVRLILLIFATSKSKVRENIVDYRIGKRDWWHVALPVDACHP